MPAREMRVDFTLFPLRSLRGQHLAQETRCFAVGKTDMSGPISERTATVVIGLAFSPGTVRISPSTAEKGSASRLISCSTSFLWASLRSVLFPFWGLVYFGCAGVMKQFFFKDYCRQGSSAFLKIPCRVGNRNTWQASQPGF